MLFSKLCLSPDNDPAPLLLFTSCRIIATCCGLAVEAVLVPFCILISYEGWLESWEQACNCGSSLPGHISAALFYVYRTAPGHAQQPWRCSIELQNCPFYRACTFMPVAR